MKNRIFGEITATQYDWFIPYFDNKHSMPYGILLVCGIVDGEVKKAYCRTLGDKYNDNCPQYIIFEKQRFIVHNIGTLYQPKFKLELWEKTKINNKWVYINNK